MFNRQRDFARKNLVFTLLHHLAGGFGLAIVLQEYFAGNPFLPVSVGWLLVAFMVVGHAIEFAAPKSNG